MTSRIFYSLMCDGCGRVEYPEVRQQEMRIKELRVQARAVGWDSETGGQAGAHDYCPPCRIRRIEQQAGLARAVGSR